MADRLELVAIALMQGCAPEALAPAVTAFIGACWPGMSRAQLLDRANRAGLRLSLRALPGPAHAGVRRYALRLTARDADVALADLVAFVRRLARRRGARRARVSLPPVRDARQGGLF